MSKHNKGANSAPLKIGVAAFAMALSAFAIAPNTQATTDPVDQVMTDLQTAGNTYLGENLLTIKTGSNGGLMYKPTGFNNYIFLNSDDQKYTYLDSPSSYTAEQLVGLSNAYISKLTTDLNFTRYNETDVSFKEYIGTVSDKEILCFIEDLDVSGVSGQASCAPIEDGYDATKKDLINELGAARPNSSTIVFDTSPTIKDSSFSPYQTLEIGSCNISAKGCGVSLYYRTSSTAQWTYFTDAQSVISCSEYNALDLRRAYLGTTCLKDDGTESKVTLEDEEEKVGIATPDTGTNTNTDSNINETVALTVASLATIVVSIAIYKNRDRFHRIKFNKH